MVNQQRKDAALLPDVITSTDENSQLPQNAAEQMPDLACYQAPKVSSNQAASDTGIRTIIDS